MSRSSSIAKFLKVLVAEQKKIEIARDKLRDLQSDVEAVAYDCDEAIDSLETAIEALSRLQ